MLFVDIKASIGFPFPKPCNEIFLTSFKSKLSFCDKLKRMVLLTPVSKMNDNCLPLTSTGITIKLFIRLNFTDCSFWFRPKKLN